mmetsp:Transcript_18746/g.24752  ORF Transcript_18746/g.24752 Transcript_18746/m.24752 type:complete len:200 (+) Transcript_18746:63-662(+)
MSNKKPTKSRSSFSFFFEDQKDGIIASKPELPFEQILEEVGDRWHTLSEEEKKTYINRADDDRERYAMEMEEYVEPATKKAKKAAEKDELAPKKPATAYLIFTNTCRNKISEENPEMSMTDKCKLMAEKWNAMDEDGKKEWNEKADADKVRFEKESATYSFNKRMVELGLPPPPRSKEPEAGEAQVQENSTEQQMASSA